MTEQIVTNQKGGRQSKTCYRLNDFPLAILAMGQARKVGFDKHGKDNWRAIDAEDHLDRALIHLNLWLAGDRSEDHLGHAICRAAMAKQLEGEADAFDARTE